MLSVDTMFSKYSATSGLGVLGIKYLKVTDSEYVSINRRCWRVSIKIGSSKSIGGGSGNCCLVVEFALELPRRGSDYSKDKMSG